MDLLVFTLTVLTLLAQLLDKFDLKYALRKRMQNVHAMYVLAIAKILMVYYGWPLVEAFVQQAAWTDTEWESCANAM